MTEGDVIRIVLLSKTYLWFLILRSLTLVFLYALVEARLSMAQSTRRWWWVAWLHTNINTVLEKAAGAFVILKTGLSFISFRYIFAQKPKAKYVCQSFRPGRAYSCRGSCRELVNLHTACMLFRKLQEVHSNDTLPFNVFFPNIKLSVLFFNELNLRIFCDKLWELKMK